jgi:hypothetical protein
MPSENACPCSVPPTHANEVTSTRPFDSHRRNWRRDESLLAPIGGVRSMFLNEGVSSLTWTGSHRDLEEPEGLAFGADMAARGAEPRLLSGPMVEVRRTPK